MKKFILAGLFMLATCFGYSQVTKAYAFVNLQKSVQKKEVVKKDTTKKVTPTKKMSCSPGHPANPSPGFDHSKDKKCTEKSKTGTCKHGKTSGCCDKKTETKQLK